MTRTSTRFWRFATLVFLLMDLSLVVTSAQAATSPEVQTMLGHVDSLKTRFAEVFANAHISAAPDRAHEYNPAQVADQYRRVEEMQVISDQMDQAYNYRFNRIRETLPQGATFSARQAEEDAFIEAGVRAHAIMAAAAAAIQYEQLHELHNRIIGERLRLHSHPRNLKQILTDFDFTLRDPHTTETITFAQAWDRVIGGMLQASTVNVAVDYRAMEQAPVLGLHTGSSQQEPAAAGGAEPARMGLPQLAVEATGPNGARQLESRDLRIDVLDRGEAGANATRFVDLLRLQTEHPIVRHPYIRDFEDEAKADGIIFTGVDYFQLDPANKAKINWLRNKWENQKKLTLRLRVPPGEYLVYPEGYRDRLPEGKANWQVPDDLSEKNITGYDFEIAESGQRIDVRTVFARVEPSLRDLRPEFHLLDFRLGTNNQTQDLEGALGGRMFQRFGKHLALQTQGEFEFRNHRDLLDLDQVMPAQFLARQQRDLFDYSAWEVQLDVGPVVRFGQFQLAAMQSLRWVKRDTWDATGLVGQFFFNAGYLFRRGPVGGQVGFYGTKSNLDEPVVKRVPFDVVLTEETFLKVADQFGVNFQLGLGQQQQYGQVEGSIGYVDTAIADAAAGGNVRWVYPLRKNLAVTAEVGLNEGFIRSNESSLRVSAGLRLGSWGAPSEFSRDVEKGAVPVIVPRIRYETLTRVVRDGNRKPVADAGPDRSGVDWRKGDIILDGSGSYDPDGDSITYKWTVEKGPAHLDHDDVANPRFTPANDQEYVFKLVVTDVFGSQSEPDVVTITTLRITQPKIVEFKADNALYRKGAGCPAAPPILSWNVEDAARITISNTSIDKTVSQDDAGQVQVDPPTTTTYTLTAFNQVNESVTAEVTITVKPCLPYIREFTATPPEIRSGEKSTLAWRVDSADRVVLTNKPGTLNSTVSATGELAVQPAETTVYTLTAFNAAGESAAAELTVTVKGPLPEIVSFKADPPEIRVGEKSALSWVVKNAYRVTLTNGAGGETTELGAPPLEVAPIQTTVYTLTVYNKGGEVAIAHVTVTVKPPLPVVRSFKADPPEISVGGSSTLSWDVANASLVTLTNGVSNAQVDSSGSQVVTPPATTTYTLTAHNSAGESATASVTVTVKSHPMIKTFRAVPPEIGVGESSTLSWEVENASRVILTNGVSNAQVDSSGSQVVTPPATTTYTLTAYNSTGESATASVTVTVKSYPMIKSFRAVPPEIGVGESSTLSWEVGNASRVTLTNGSSEDPVPLSGSQVVTPPATTTYTLTAYNSTGESATASVTVTVKSHPMIKSFQATPPEIRQGQSSILSWEVVNASRVTLSNANPSTDGTVAPKDSLLVSPRVTTTYTLTACNPAGDCLTASVTLAVKPALPVIITFIAEPSSIVAGESSVLSWRVEQASRVTLTNSVDGWNVPLVHELLVSPNQTTTYTLTAFNAAGEVVSAAVTITVEGGLNPPVIFSFQATRLMLNAGECTTLAWSTKGAWRTTLANFTTGLVEEVVSNGSLQVCPTVTTKYILTVFNKAGDKTTASLTVQVQ